MSVINQMLQDLDKRQQGHCSNEPAQGQQLENQVQRSWWIIAVLAFIIVGLLAAYAWHVHTENQSLKQALVDSKTVQEPSKKTAPVIASKSTPLPMNANEVQKSTEQSKQIVSSTSPTLSTEDNKQVTINASTALSSQDIGSTDDNGAKKLVTPVIEQKTNANVERSEGVKLTQEKVTVSPVEKVPTSKLSISRRQLSANELADKKYQQASQALSFSQLDKAESLLEDVLLVMPEHIDARAQLAALWFGKKQYQSAVNLLSQGIAIAPNHSDFRLMQAKIYLTTNQRASALQTLAALPEVSDIEYQSLLATTAQQDKKHDIALSAYRQLTRLQPSKGKWWLGLAIAYDSLGEFTHAVPAYKAALAKGNVANSVVIFIQQRLRELGE